jgi:hypothetical protein
LEAEKDENLDVMDGVVLPAPASVLALTSVVGTVSAAPDALDLLLLRVPAIFSECD